MCLCWVFCCYTVPLYLHFGYFETWVELHPVRKEQLHKFAFLNLPCLFLPSKQGTEPLPPKKRSLSLVLYAFRWWWHRQNLPKVGHNSRHVWSLVQWFFFLQSIWVTWMRSNLNLLGFFFNLVSNDSFFEAREKTSLGDWFHPLRSTLGFHKGCKA